jgi:predicted N-acetyltransferase YhbS
MIIRAETEADREVIAAVTGAAFETAPHSGGNEAQIVSALRAAGALSLSLVAEEDGRIVGHAAFSPVRIPGAERRWFGLGPVSVLPARQRAGIGSALIREGLERLRASGAKGCVVLGEPAYYGRFGFVSDPILTYGGAPSDYFRRLVFDGPAPAGDVDYHPAFGDA